jgi:5-formyltetrahydrofolate cyclo-ligase
MKEEKTALRELIRGEAIMMGEEERRQSDEALFQNLRTLPEFQKARSLFLFAGIGTERIRFLWRRRCSRREETSPCRSRCRSGR